MNKTKKELFEENKALKKKIIDLNKENVELEERMDLYYDFWQLDATSEYIKKLNYTKKLLYIISSILLILSAFLWGLSL